MEFVVLQNSFPPAKLSRYVCTLMEHCVLPWIIQCFYFMDFWGNSVYLFCSSVTYIKNSLT
ncbi:hypothetical protein Fmac_014475 [Flemingia macrophylla]|uniref:Uncharacterized protein n=1 Tax=Flemingia macrophylla TaxID=520843 RepID=A0ABD1MBY5_9FABA